MYLQINKNMKPRARDLRKARNYAEVILWRELKNGKMMGLDFDRQKVIGSYIADFCCEHAKLVIEVDGSSHIGREEYDKERDEYMQGLGLKIFRISDFDVKHNLEYVLAEIKKVLCTLKV